VFGLSKRQGSLDERGFVYGLSELVKVQEMLVFVKDKNLHGHDIFLLSNNHCCG